MNGAAPAPQQHVAGDDEIRMLAVKAFNEAIDADGYETSYDIIENAIKAALGQTALRKDNGDELLGAHPFRFGNPDLAHEGDEPGVAVQLNGEVRGTDHRVSPLSREENTPPDDLPLSKVAASENHVRGIGPPHRAAIEAFNAASVRAHPVSHRTIRTAFLDQNVELPLRLSDDDVGVVFDRHGCDVFTVDVNNERPDEEAMAIALFIVECVNEAAGFTEEKLDA
jgi:hypothetical protein